MTGQAAVGEEDLDQHVDRPGVRDYPALCVCDVPGDQLCGVEDLDPHADYPALGVCDEEDLNQNTDWHGVWDYPALCVCDEDDLDHTPGMARLVTLLHL